MKKRGIIICIVWMISLGGLCLLIFLSMLNFPFSSIFAREEIHAKDAYAANWGLVINENCREEYYSESKERAFGEGQRCSVLTGINLYGIEDRSSSDPSTNTSTVEKSAGYGFEAELDDFLTDVYKELDVPEEYCAFTKNCNWISLSMSDGSHLILLVIEDPSTKQQSAYIVEELM